MNSIVYNNSEALNMENPRSKGGQRKGIWHNLMGSREEKTYFNWKVRPVREVQHLSDKCPKNREDLSFHLDQVSV